MEIPGIFVIKRVGTLSVYVWCEYLQLYIYTVAASAFAGLTVHRLISMLYGMFLYVL